MSTRYVWGKYYLVSTYKEEQYNIDIVDYNKLYLTKSYTFDKNKGVYILDSSARSYSVDAWLGYSEDRESTEYGRYSVSGDKKRVSILPAASSKYFWRIGASLDTLNRGNIHAYGMERISSNVIQTTNTTGYRIISGPDTNGDFIEYNSSLFSSTYPNNGSANSYWYKYLGSDNIDPQSISYITEVLAGKVINLKVIPRTPTQPGTVYYQYQYSINNGSTWTNIGSKTTATNVNVTIPTNATQFKARVLASDNLGFTSTTYVVGSNIAIQTGGGDNYIGIGGTARQIEKIYIGVDGTAREVVEGYIGIGGTARKFYG